MWPPGRQCAIPELADHGRFALAREHYDDPNWSMLAWGRLYFEIERSALVEIWPNALAPNRDSLTRFIGYTHEQGLISRRLAPKELFTPDTTTLRAE